MTEKQDLTSIRREYASSQLTRESLQANPFEQFRLWLAEAQKVEERDPTAMTLATYNEAMGPAARIVLLKHFDTQGFCWYTDFDSHKGVQLAEIPRAELLFYWPSLERQVRINGTVIKLDRAHAVEYFNERPLGSRLSAAASDQSEIVASREYLEQKVAELQQRYAEGEVPCPDNWGGYCLQPQRFEFWQGRENRLHDRFRYQLQQQQWQVDRLSP